MGGKSEPQSRRSRRAAPEGPQRSGGPGAAGLRHAAAGLRAATDHPLCRGRKQRRRATRGVHRSRAPAHGSNGAQPTRTLESGRPSRRRARAAVRQPPPRPPAGSSVPRGNAKALRTLAASQNSASARSSKPAVNLPAPPARQRSKPAWAETHSDSAARMRRRARPRDSAGRQDPIAQRSVYARAGIPIRQCDRTTPVLRIWEKRA